MALNLVRRTEFGWPSTPKAPTAPCRNGIAVHYDGSVQRLADKKHQACVDYWKSTRKFHMGPRRGWNDIGYSYAVCPHGYAFEGRGFGRAQAAQPGGNSTWTSVTFMSGEGEKPTAKQLQAFRDLRAWLRGRGVGSKIDGHRDFIATSCPGKVLYALVTNGSSGLYKGGVSAPAKASPVAAPSGFPALREGSEGDRVKQLQRALNKALKLKLAVDGDYGPATKKAVRALQSKSKIDADGVYGPISASKLKALL